MIRFKLVVGLFGLLWLAVSIAHAQQSDGSGSGQDVSKLRLKLPFVDRTQFVDRGAIAYTIPPVLNDGIPVADARDFGDLQNILELLNQTERKNQDFRIGKGKPHKRGGRKPYDPKIVGCIDSLLVAKNGKLVLEEYFGDARTDKPHYQMSITKSILAYAIGKAIEQRKIKSVNDRLVDYLPGLERGNLPKGVEKLTLHDLLTMKSGLRVDTKDSRQSSERSIHAEQILSKTKPIPADRSFKYDGVNCELLVHVLYNATGKTLGEFAGEHLFGPMGITDFSFGKSSCGLDKGSAGMRLRSRDMLKIGLLTSAGGKWGGKQVLSADWIDRATAVHVNQDKPTQYGYYWWSHEVPWGDEVVRVRSCRGAGGQFIFVVPEKDLVAVFTSYYSDNRPIQHFDRLILPVFAADAKRVK
ncbi:MAG: serine hydrolase [Pirellulaceae bacterium]|nr:serine hydrolase [Pirellulaceae bacterium]